MKTVTKKKRNKNISENKNRTKRWKKGQSCVSNPVSKTHREAAKNRFFNYASGPSGLTQEALAKHDATQEDGDGDVSLDHDDAASQGRSSCAKSTSTWASGWTECTNVTFSKVHRFWKSDSAQHKAVLAVLAAITEVIKANGGKESDTEYFAALMTALDGEPEDEESLAAITHLLHMCMKRVPVTVLKSKFSAASKVLMNVLSQHMNTESGAFLRSTIQCLSQLLRVQEHAAWSNSSTLNIFNAILTLTLHAKPKVRKVSQHAVAAVLRGSTFMIQTPAPTHHPAASAAAKFCVEQIETSGGSAAATVTLHTLGLLQDVLPVFPPSGVKTVCETILKVMTLANVMVSSVSMKCLHKMFTSRPKASSLSAELNAQLITALYDFQPGDNDWQLMMAWLALMKEAHSNLKNLNEDLFLSHLPRYYSSAMTALKGAHEASVKVALAGLMSILRDDLGALSEKLESVAKASGSAASPVHKIFKAVEGGLSYQYFSVWGQILELLNVCFEVLGKSCHRLMGKCLQTLADLRGSHNFPHKLALDNAVGMAVRTIGPRRVLAAIPLQITGDQDSYDFPRSWILPVLRENVRDTELAYFTGYFLPLAAKLRTKALQCSDERQTVEARTYHTLQLQIWSLLPGFCTRPTDLLQSFKTLAKVLGVALRDRDDIRMELLSSIRKLIQHNMDNDENRSELGKFAKNYLPLLFNLFTADPDKEKDSMRLSVLDTVRVYAKICDEQLIKTYIEMCHTKLADSEITGFRRKALLDIQIALVCYADRQTLNNIYPQTVANLKSSDRTVQKKSYRVLEQICGSETADCKQFVASHLGEFQESLLQSLSKSSPSAKAPRLRCLIQIMKQLDGEEIEFVQKVVPEAVLCTKETALKARQAAYILLVEMAHALFRWNPETPKAAVLQIYYEMICAGLAGKPHVVVCTILSLGRVTYEFKDYVSDEIVGLLIESTCMLLPSGAREVVKASLSLMKVLVTSFDEMTVGQSLEKIISSLVSIKDTNKHQLRFKVKDIFTRLIRKFGYNIVKNQVPESYHKMFTHIRKTQERAKRKKQARGARPEGSDEEEDEVVEQPKGKPESFEEFLAGSEDEMDMDDEKPRAAGRKVKRGQRKQPQGAAWLHENRDETEPVDFLDPSVSRKVMSTKPQAEGKKKIKGDGSSFKMAPDGRMIIREGSDEEEETSRKRKKTPIDDLDELIDALEGPGKKSRKRKISSVKDEDEEETEPSQKYKAGGSGIHRPLRKVDPGREFKAKKAGGDIKKKGKPEPYAYIPLEFSTLNKRKNAKASGKFNGLVRGARKGAHKGQKIRAKQKK